MAVSEFSVCMFVSSLLSPLVGEPIVSILTLKVLRMMLCKGCFFHHLRVNKTLYNLSIFRFMSDFSASPVVGYLAYCWSPEIDWFAEGCAGWYPITPQPKRPVLYLLAILPVRSRLLMGLLLLERSERLP